MKNILIIDDDMYIGDMLEEVLIKHGYCVSRVYSGTEALLVLNNLKPNLILLDLNLPGLSGDQVLKQISNIPVIVVSAKCNVDDKISLLMSGAVDYITKPFDINELLARISVQLRNPVYQNIDGIITFEQLQLNINTHTIMVNDNHVKLTRTEYAIIKILMMNSSQVITKSRMLDEISIDTPDCSENSLKIHISNLRKKLKDASDKNYIEAVWGIGFKLRKD